MQAPTSLVLVFSAEVTHSGVTYPRGLVAYVPPTSSSIENWFVLPADFTEAIATLTNSSAAGDDIRFASIGTAQNLTDAVTAQSTAGTGLVLYFSAEVTRAGETYVVRQVAYIAPRSTTIRRWFVVPAGGTGTGGDAPDTVLNASKGTVETKGLFTQELLDLRQAGDLVARFSAPSAASLSSELENLKRNHNAGLIRITRFFTTATRTYYPGEVFYLAPHHDTELQMVLVVERDTYFGKIDILPSNIAAAADLDGAYQLTLSDLQVHLLTAFGVNALEIWFKDEPVEQITSWTPATTVVLTATVDTTEETQVGLESTDAVIPVRVVFQRRSGGNVDFVASIGTWLTIGGEAQDTPSGPDLPPWATIQIEPSSVRDEFPPFFDFLFTERIGTLTITAATCLVGGQSLTLDTSAAQLRLITDRGRLRFTIPTLTRDSLSNNIAADDEAQQYELTLTLSDGTTHTHRGNIVVNDPQVPREPEVVQAAVDGGDTAGVASLTLPVNYANYRRLSFAIWSTDNDNIIEAEMHCALLTVQTANRNIAVGNRNNRNLIEVLWNPTARTLTGSNIRFIYAVLED